MRKIFTSLLMVISLSVFAWDSFDDGNFTVNPTWVGSTGDWQVVPNSDVAAGATGSNTLRLNASVAGLSYLSTQSWAGGDGDSQMWCFFVGRRGQPYTASNHALIWLWASEQNLTSSTVDGYRIRIGDDAGGDEIVLQRVTDGVATDILIGPALTNGLTDVGFSVRVLRSESGWHLYTSLLPTTDGTGTIATNDPVLANVYHGVVMDNVVPITNIGYIGFVVAYTGSLAARTAQEFDQLQLVVTLPVELKRFDAAKDGNGVKLSWDVVEESNVFAYEVQRSENDIRFTTIGSKSAEGKTKYVFTDNQPAADNRFYRLRIVDIDGSSSFSHIVSVKSKSGLGLKAAPNPVRSSVNVRHPKAAADSRLQVINASGKVVMQRMIPENAVLSPMNLSGLPNGIYHLVFIDREKRINELIVKQ